MWGGADRKSESEPAEKIEIHPIIIIICLQGIKHRGA